MALRRTIDNYGGEKVDARPVKNPTSQLAAAHFSLMAEETAQMTNTAYRAVCRSTTTAAGSPAKANTSVWTLWGSGDTQKPTIGRNSAGQYTITYPTTLANSLGTSETVSFVAGHVSVVTADATDDIQGRIVTLSGNVANIVVQAAGVPADAGDSSGNLVEVTVWLL